MRRAGDLPRDDDVLRRRQRPVLPSAACTTAATSSTAGTDTAPSANSPAACGSEYVLHDATRLERSCTRNACRSGARESLGIGRGTRRSHVGSEQCSNFLYATDFHNGKVDVFDAQFRKVAAPGGFVDPALPAGYAPFGIQAVSFVPAGATAPTTVIVVTYAQHVPENLDLEIKGPGLGLVNVFDANGTLIRNLVGVGAQLNAPWGVVLAPATFGSLGSMLLIGNFGDGAIHAFDPNTGAFVDTVKDAAGQPIVLEGLWGLAFGNDALGQPASSLFFAAGIGAETAGLYGRIDLR